jgi:LmbE family N-acetylglucosaminyl deacetylase
MTDAAETHRARGDIPAPQPGDRVMAVAPHPDDETVATGGLLALAVEAGAAVRVVFLTDGDRNPWAQRAFERRIRIRDADRRRFGSLRRGEALAALAALGVAAADVAFLGLPDQGLTADLLAGGPALGLLREETASFAPTLVVGPSIADCHPDHSAAAVLLQLAMEGSEMLSSGAPPLSFLVHNPALRQRSELFRFLPLPAWAVARKTAALARHRSQLILRGTMLRSFAGDREPFLESAGRPLPEHPVVAVERPLPGRIEIHLAPRLHTRAPGPATVFIAALGRDGVASVCTVPLPLLGRRAVVRDLASGRPISRAAFTRTPGGCRLSFEVGREFGRVAVKLDRRFGFFDEGGWLVEQG